MPQVCKVCTSAHGRSVDQKLRAAESYTSVAAWLTANGEPVSRAAVQRHAQNHLNMSLRAPGPAPAALDFLERVRDTAAARMASGEIAPTVGDGLKAVGILDQRTARHADEELAVRLALVIGGAAQFAAPRIIDHDDAMELEAAEDYAAVGMLGSGEAVGPSVPAYRAEQVAMTQRVRRRAWRTRP